MATYRAFRSQLATIMETLTRAAVAEICELVDDGYAVLHVEISRHQKENEELRRKLQLIESIIAARGFSDEKAAARELQCEAQETQMIQKTSGCEEMSASGAAQVQAYGMEGVSVPLQIKEESLEQAPLECEDNDEDEESVSAVTSNSSKPDLPQLSRLDSFTFSHSSEPDTHSQTVLLADVHSGADTQLSSIDLTVSEDALPFAMQGVPNTCTPQFHHTSPIFTAQQLDLVNFSGMPPLGQLSTRGHGTGKRRFTCSICGKSFTTSQSLDIHTRIHTGERPYRCEQCGKRFTQSNHLSVHRSVHTGERPYECTCCGKRFTGKQYLKKHTRKHHTEQFHTFSHIATLTQQETLL